MFLKYKKWLLLATVALIPILSGCDGCDKKKYIASSPTPSAPSNLTGSIVSSTQINLTWQDNSTNEKGFYVYRRITGDYSRIAVLVVNATSYSDTGLSPETTYWYKTTAYNDGGESASSNEISVTTPAGSAPPPLEAPSNLTANALSYKYVQLSWEDNSTDEDGFKVHFREGLGLYETVATLGPNSTFYGHDSLQPMIECEYYVEAYRGAESANSEHAYATTLEAPVEIVEYWLDRLSNRTHYLCGYLKSAATEPCLVELTAQYHITSYLFYEYSEWETCIYTVKMQALAENTFFKFQWAIPMDIAPTVGDKKVDCQLEITDVEIEY